MKKNSLLFVLAFFAVAGLILFKDFFLKGHLPLPFDLLVSEYPPYKYESYLGYNPGSYPNKAQYFDVIRQMYPWKSFVIESLKDFNIPFWNPYNFSGTPMMANNQSAVFYPANLLFLVLPRDIAWVFYLFLQPVLAAFFTYIFAKSIKLSILASLFSGTAFGFGLFMASFFEYGIVGHTILWLPLLLFGAEKMSGKKPLTGFLIIVLGVTCSFLAGHLQLFFLSFGLFWGYVFLKAALSRGDKIVLSPIFVSILAIGLWSFLLSQIFELIHYSARVSHTHSDLMRFLIQPKEFVLFFSPDFFGNPVTRNYMLPDSYPGNAVYIGLVGIFFTVIALLNWKKNVQIKIFSILLLLCLLITTKNPISFMFYKIPLSFITSSSPSNALFLVSFLGAILSGFGIDHFLTKKIRITEIIIFTAVLILSVILALFFHDEFIKKSLIYTLGLFAVVLSITIFSWIKPGYKKVACWFLLIILFADLFYYFNKFNPFSPKEFAFPQTEVISFLQKNAGINRVWGYGFASLDSNIETLNKIYSTNGYDPLYPKWYGEFINSSKDGKITSTFNETTRSNAFLTPGFGDGNMMQNTNRLRVMDSLGVKYILDRAENGSTEKTFPVTRFKKVFGKNGWFIYENLLAAPRVFYTSSLVNVKDKKQFEKVFFSDSFDPSKSAVIMGENAIPGKENRAKVQIKNLVYKPNSIEFDLSPAEEGFVIISDTWYPRWEVKNPRGVKILKVNHAFRAIPIDKNTQRVQLEYNGGIRVGNMYDLLAVSLSFMSLVLLTGYGYRIYKKK